MSEEEVDENGEDVETIYVGSKPLMSYVMASMSIFLDENPSKIKIAARGRAISRAVDTAEVLRRRYLKGIIDVEKVDISTDEVEDKKQATLIGSQASLSFLIKSENSLLGKRND